MRITTTALQKPSQHTLGVKPDGSLNPDLIIRSPKLPQDSESVSKEEKMPALILPLKLIRLDHTQIAGIYGTGGDKFASRMAFLYPSAAESFLKLLAEHGSNIVLSDMFRSSTASLNRKYPTGRLPKLGVARPAHSAHNYGFAIDIAVDRTMDALGCSKATLDALMESYGWYCHRMDHKRGSEDWHYNFLGSNPGILPKENRTSGAVERHIAVRYGQAWDLQPHQIQACLKAVGLYDGDLDGKLGPLSITAVKAFQRTWKLSADGKVGPLTGRMLWYRAAELRSIIYQKQ